MLRYVISEKQKLVVTEYSGELDYSTMVRYMNVVWDDPECNSGYSSICDLSRVQLRMSSKDVENVFFQVMADERSLKGTCALVISTPLETALGFIFKHTALQADAKDAPDMAIQVFYEWENACEFVNCLTDRASFNWKTVE